MKDFFSDKWNPILLGLGVLLAIEMIVLVTRPAPPCYASLDVTKGQNFNQPIFTTHNCKPGQVPENIDDFVKGE